MIFLSVLTKEKLPFGYKIKNVIFRGAADIFVRRDGFILADQSDLWEIVRAIFNQFHSLVFLPIGGLSDSLCLL